MEIITTSVTSNQHPSQPSSINSPAVSMYSRHQSSRSSISSASMSASPVPPRDSFDLYGSAKRLEDVREEPHEREDEDWSLNDEEAGYNAGFDPRNYGTSLPVQMEYSLGDQDAWSTNSSGHRHAKRQRSLDHRNSFTDKVASRFGSISRRWRNRSGVGPQLSIVTHGPVTQRSSSAASSHILSPALSAISQHETHLPASPVAASIDETLRDPAVIPFFMETITGDEEDEVHERGQATTPLLPPTVAALFQKEVSLLQSPLQSPSIAPTTCVAGSRMSVDHAVASLPSPPLSTRPSIASMHRGRCENVSPALAGDIPPLSLHEDPWDSLLGHANFFIHPEPYRPGKIDIETYKEFRANWSLARKQYAQHITRTTEHYGKTSRVYMLTQEKWDEIDDAWKTQDNIFSRELSTDLARLSDGDVGGPGSPNFPSVLDKPITRVVVPQLDQDGKFPEIGDADIVGPLAVAPAKAPELQRNSVQSPPMSPRKRSLFKYLSDVLGRHNNIR